MFLHKLARTPIPPSATENPLGVIGGDNGGFPNGRRLGDDVVDAAERVMAGFLKGNKVELGDGVNSGDVPNLASFPYESAPQSGFANGKGEPRSCSNACVGAALAAPTHESNRLRRAGEYARGHET